MHLPLFGAVVLARVLRDEWGHSLGLGIVHIAHSEDGERLFNEHQRFEVSGSRVDLWEPAELDDPQVDRLVVYNHRAVEADQDTGQEKSRKPLKPLLVLLRRLVQPLMSSDRTAKD